MIHLHSVGHIADTQSLLRVGVRHNDYLVTPFNQALSELEHVHLDTAEVRVEVVTH
jgi:hypothetical protein